MIDPIYIDELEHVDASVFSGEMVSDEETREKFKEYLARWQREIDRNEISDERNIIKVDEIYKQLNTSKLPIIVKSAHELLNWYKSRVGQNLQRDTEDKIIYAIAFLWAVDEIYRLKKKGTE